MHCIDGAHGWRTALLARRVEPGKYVSLGRGGGWPATSCAPPIQWFYGRSGGGSAQDVGGREALPRLLPSHELQQVALGDDHV